MEIQEIRLENYRQFRNQKIYFKKCVGNDIHIIIGTNGVGKSNLLNGINWCLYDDEPHLGITSKALPIVNLITLDEADFDVDCNVCVEITCSMDQGLLTFTRKAVFRKTENSKNVIRIKSNFSVVTQFENQGIKFFEEEDAQKWLNNFVPLSIREYFFFDGERLDNYFIKETGSKIKDSIFEISQIKLISNVRYKLENVIKDLLKEETKDKPDIEKIRKEYEQTQDLISDHQIELSEIRDQISKSQQIIAECNEYLRGMPEVENLEAKRESLIQKSKIIKNKLFYKRNEYYSFIKDSVIKINTFPGITFSSDLIDELHENGKLPPNVDKNFLEQMVLEDKCEICGNKLTLESKRTIFDLITKLELSSTVSHELMEIRPSLRIIQSSLQEFRNKLRKFSSELDEIIKERDENQREIEEINQTLEGFNDKQKIIQKHRDREQHEQLKEDNLRREGVINNALVEEKKNLEKKKKELDAAIKQNGNIEIATVQRIFAEEAKNSARFIEEKLLNEVREKIQNTTDKIFKDLVWKKDTFKQVVLGNDYSLSLLHVDGYECLGSCGAAERALFALSLTLAIHKESGFLSPLIIDTPLARISGANRENFAKVLGEVSINKQIFLFLTHDEYSSSVSNILNPLLCSRYFLVSRNNERETLIEKE